MFTTTILFTTILYIHNTYSQTYVDDSTTCSTCNGSSSNPYKTLQDGLNNVIGSSLHIAAGTYKGPGNVNLTVQNAFSNIYGAGSDTTIIDCENQNHFQGWHLQSGTFTMQGLTIRNCKAIQRSIDYNGVLYGGVWGGGLWIVSTSTTLRDINIEGNEAENGGGIAIFSDAVFIENSVISGNKAEYGGGIFIQKAYLKLDNVTIKDNTVKSNGGGIYGINGGDTELFGVSLISDNDADGNGNQIACVNGSQFWVKSDNAKIDGNVHCDGCVIGTTYNDNFCDNNGVFKCDMFIIGFIVVLVIYFVN